MIKQNEMNGCISASAVTDIFYFLQKQYKSPDVALSLLKKLTRILKILMANHEIIETAFDSDMDDFEDAVQAAAAKNYGIDIVVTRDKAEFHNSGLQIYSPEEFLAMIPQQQRTRVI